MTHKPSVVAGPVSDSNDFKFPVAFIMSSDMRSDL